ncbi:MAG TPA: alpha/beta hydrolase [Candidatus Dormibacteraeota bacterium]|nr:alpha/beta hydrolase [Candidatus Dormibacteraeota bacterium]
MSKTGHIEANGVNYYYEVHGRGEPLLLLHGGLGSIDMFASLIPALAADREVIAVDLHGHGRTALGDRKVDLRDMGDDMAVIVRHLGHRQVDAMGYSLGGGVAFRFAVQHPELVRRLVIMSAGFSTAGFHPEMLPMQSQVSGAAAEFMKDTPMYQTYAAVAPHPEDFPKLLDRVGEYMRQPFDFSEDVKKLEMPVMLVFADSDMFTTPHIAEFYNMLGGNLRDAGWQRENMSQNRLAILPDHTHYDVFLAPELASTVLPFLNGRRQTEAWSDVAHQSAG